MAYSFVSYLGDGGQTDFVVPFPYLEKSHVAVTSNGVVVSFEWVGSTMIRVTPAPAYGAPVRISRSSNRQARLTDYQDAEVLSEQMLDYDATQMFYVAQEAYDAVGEAAVGGDMRRSMNLSDVYNAEAARLNIGAVGRSGDTMQGPLYLASSPAMPNEAASKAYVDSIISSLAGVLSFNGRTGIVQLNSGDVVGALSYTPVNRSGDTLTGFLSAAADPTNAMHLATKQYVDSHVAAANTGDYTFPQVSGQAAAIAIRSVNSVGAYTGATDYRITRTGGQAMVGLATRLWVNPSITTNADIGLQNIIAAKAINGGGIIGENIIAAGPPTSTGTRSMIGLQVSTIERANDMGLRPVWLSPCSTGILLHPDNFTNLGDGSPIRAFNNSFGMVITSSPQAGDGSVAKTWIPILVDLNATAPGGTAIRLNGGLLAADGPLSQIDMHGNATLGIDMSNATFTDADHTAIKLAMGQCIHFSPYSRIYTDPSGNLTFYDEVVGAPRTLASLGGGGGGGTSLLPLDNTWTGRNIHTKLAAVNAPATQFKSEATGAIANVGILLNTGYSTGFDVRKTTSNSTECPGGGGVAAAYIQHQVAGNNSISNVNSGLRVQLQTSQTRTGSVGNDAAAGYFGLFNGGVDCAGFGLHTDSYHAASGGVPTTYGVSSEMYRQSSAGNTVGVHARSIGGVGGYSLQNDYGFLASTGGNMATGFTRAFAAGSPLTGVLPCEIGLDLGFATCNQAAISIGTNKFIAMDAGGSNIGRFRYEASIEFGFYNSTSKRIGLSVYDGSIIQWDGSYGYYGQWYIDAAGQRDAIMSVRSGGRTDQPDNPFAIANWLAIRVDGIRYKLPLYL